MAYVILFEGLSGAGKTTLAECVSKEIDCVILDGDAVRRTINRDLGFSIQDRHENLRRIGEIARLLQGININVLIATITPFNNDRQMLRDMLGPDFIEVYCKAPLKVCEARDPKGNYKLAREGKIQQYTGINSAFEQPDGADLILNTNKLSIEECTKQVIRKIKCQ